MRGGAFPDRVEAGRQLAEAVNRLLHAHPEMRDPVVLALPRGGVPLALEVARVLGAPLDLVLVRKIGVPYQPELAAAAVVDGADPQMVVNEDVVRACGMSGDQLAAARARQLEEIERRRALYLEDRPPVPLEGRDLIVIDDGVATGATMRAALKALRRRGPRSLTLAVPVAARDTLSVLEREVDHAVCLLAPELLYGIGAHYAEFHQLADSEVQDLIAEADRLLADGDGPPG